MTGVRLMHCKNGRMIPSTLEKSLKSRTAATHTPIDVAAARKFYCTMAPMKKTLKVVILGDSG